MGGRGARIALDARARTPTFAPPCKLDQLRATCGLVFCLPGRTFNGVSLFECMPWRDLRPASNIYTLLWYSVSGGVQFTGACRMIPHNVRAKISTSDCC